MNAAQVEELLDVVHCARAQPTQAASSSRTQKAPYLERQVVKEWLVEYVLLEMKFALRVVEEEVEEAEV